MLRASLTIHEVSELRMLGKAACVFGRDEKTRQSQNHCTKENTIAAFFGMKFESFLSEYKKASEESP
jgi:hypothetical protein